MVEKLIGLWDRFENDQAKYVEDEVLYGNAGYLYCLLTILKEVDPKNKEVITIARKIIDVIISDGKKWSKSD